jgi:murein DD-endopeptidase MepM/ murein hydrolase activator NlpD
MTPGPVRRTPAGALARAGSLDLRRVGLFGVLALVTTVTLAGLALTAAPASAGGEQVAGTVRAAGAVLNVRPAPNTDTARTGWLPDGSTLTIVCQKRGERIHGSQRTTRMWDRLAGGGYVSDAYVHRTGPKPPRCGTRQARAAAADAWVLPVPDPVGSSFRTKARPDHDGVDFVAARNTPILAVAAGTVTVAQCDPGTGNCDVDGSIKAAGCGWYVEIQHPDAVTRYCHLVRAPEVRVGEHVAAGVVIGHVGNSGNSTGPHLHFEVHSGLTAHRGNAVDPVRFLRDAGLPIR